MEDAGAIAGTVVDAATDRPVAGAAVLAGCIERNERIRGSHRGVAVSDARGHFMVGGLPPGVCSVGLESSPMGRRFFARAVEGVRVQAGREARADLRLIEGRRLRGTAVYAATGEPVAGALIVCQNTSRPRPKSQLTYTDDQGRFESFVLPGPAVVHLVNSDGPGSPSYNTLLVPDDRDPEPVLLERGHDPNAKPAPGPQLVGLVECEVRVRVKADSGDRAAPGDDRTLTGRIFDQDGSPLPAIQIGGFFRGQTFIEAATDRTGFFRMKGLPPGELRINVHRDDDHGMATIPAGAVEVDLILTGSPGETR
jgi:hypothetical protein